jgi:hypothetical protein
MTISAAILTSRSTYSAHGQSRNDDWYVEGFPTVKIDASSTSASIEYLEWDTVTVLRAPRQFHNGLYAFNDLPLNYRCECNSRVQMDRCRT